MSSTVPYPDKAKNGRDTPLGAGRDLLPGYGDELTHSD